MIILPKLRSQSCVRLLSISLRNLSISTKSSSATNYPTNSNNNNGNFSPYLAPFTSNVTLDVGIGGPLWRKKEINELPLTNKVVENPIQITKIIEEIQKKNDLNLPTSKVEEEILAVKRGNERDTTVYIRKAKMRKHKRRKLWKKMKFVWTKVRLRRRIKNEKRFVNEINMKMSEARNFSAEDYVAEKLKLATVPPLCRKWKGKRLPAFIILELLKEQEDKRLKKKFDDWEKTGKQAGLF